MKASKRTIIKKVMGNFDEHGWTIIDHYDHTSMAEMFKPLFAYLESKGIDLT
jgi:hypothetical protein